MLVYLDNCVFNRPFDDQSAERIRIETISTLQVLRKITLGRVDLAWSYVNETENFRNPSEEIRRSIQKWKEIAVVEILESENLLKNAKKTVRIRSRNRRFSSYRGGCRGKY